MWPSFKALGAFHGADYPEAVSPPHARRIGGSGGKRTGPACEKEGHSALGKVMLIVNSSLPKQPTKQKGHLEAQGNPLKYLVGAIRFERTTPCSQGRCATRLRYAPTRNTTLYAICLQPARRTSRRLHFLWWQPRAILSNAVQCLQGIASSSRKRKGVRERLHDAQGHTPPPSTPYPVEP